MTSRAVIYGSRDDGPAGVVVKRRGTPSDPAAPNPAAESMSSGILHAVASFSPPSPRVRGRRGPERADSYNHADVGSMRAQGGLQLLRVRTPVIGIDVSQSRL